MQYTPAVLSGRGHGRNAGRSRAVPRSPFPPAHVGVYSISNGNSDSHSHSNSHSNSWMS